VKRKINYRLQSAQIGVKKNPFSPCSLAMLLILVPASKYKEKYRDTHCKNLK